MILLAIAAAASLAASVPLDRPAQIQSIGVKAETVQYRGRSALKLTEALKNQDNPLAILTGVTLRNGTIDVDLTGELAAGADQTARGFVGIAFHMDTDAKHFEYMYLRPTNGRADDQVRRNHSVQYASHPDYPWPRLRKEEPEKYEAYADLEPGAWTKVRIVISGAKALLYVNGASQPVLVVNDLKLGSRDGGIALWLGPGTEAHFANLTVTPAP